jgi:hypothetical protein
MVEEAENCWFSFSAKLADFPQRIYEIFSASSSSAGAVYVYKPNGLPTRT